MGRIERKGAKGVVRYIWYPGDIKDWKRAAISLGAGLAVGVIIGIAMQSSVWGVVVGTSTTAAITGLAFGQKDARALPNFASFRIPETGRALWRALVKGFGTALAAVLVSHVVSRSGLSSWVLPLVPATVAAIAHQFGMMQVRLAEERETQKAAEKALFPKKAPATSAP